MTEPTREEEAQDYADDVDICERTSEGTLRRGCRIDFLAGMAAERKRVVAKCQVAIDKYQSLMDEMAKKFELDPRSTWQNKLWEFQALRDVAKELKAAILAEGGGE